MVNLKNAIAWVHLAEVLLLKFASLTVVTVVNNSCIWVALWILAALQILLWQVLHIRDSMKLVQCQIWIVTLCLQNFKSKNLGQKQANLEHVYMDYKDRTSVEAESLIAETITTNFVKFAVFN